MKYKHFDVEHSMLENQINMYANNGYKLVAFTCYENSRVPTRDFGTFITNKHVRMYAVIMEKVINEKQTMAEYVESLRGEK